MNESNMFTGMFLLIIGAAGFIPGVVLTAVSKKTRIAGIIVLITAVVLLIIGGGMCFGNLK